jgi:hypothetical protein
MHQFITRLIEILHAELGGDTKLQRCMRQELRGDLFRQYGYASDEDNRARSTLYFALDALAEPVENAVPGDVSKQHALGVEVLRSLRHMDASISRISSMTSPAKLEVLNTILSLPCVDMTDLVNDWLASDLRPGQNKMLVHVASSSALFLVAPSTLAEGLEWTRMADCCDLPTLHHQFALIDKAIADIARAGQVPEPLNGEGFPGPVAGWGGH